MSVTRLLVVQHEDDVSLGRLEAVLTASGAVLDVVRPDRGQAQPASAAAWDGLIVLGGQMAAWEDDVAGWLPATRDLLRAAVAEGTPTLGICLGAQLLGMACGGTVERGAAGLEGGLIAVRPTAAAREDVVFGPVGTALGERWTVPSWHADAVTRLPPDAVLLAVGDRYPHQAFRVGERAWGVQYHPEVSPENFAVWAAGAGDELRAVGGDPDAALAAVLAREAPLAALAAAHALAFVAVCAARRNPSGAVVVDQV